MTFQRSTPALDVTKQHEVTILGDRNLRQHERILKHFSSSFCHSFSGHLA
jgi:hypothetical protein